MSNLDKKIENSTQDPKNSTNNFTNNTILNNSFRPPTILSQNVPNANPNITSKPTFPFPYIINPVIFNNPNFKQMYPQIYQNMPLVNNTVNNPNATQNNTNNINNNPNTTTINGNPMKMPVMGIPVLFPTFMLGGGVQDQTPLVERCKIWVGKIPEGISETFMRKLLECCGQVTSWRRVTNSSGKFNSFGFCEYSTVESILKCLRLLNGYPLLGSELQVKIGNDTEEFLKKWRQRKKAEWINSLAVQGIPVNLEEIKRKEENGEPLEWELRLVSNDQDILKKINEVVSQRQVIDTRSKQNENDNTFFKDLNELANSNILENVREKERKKKKMEKIKKFEKLFYDFEKNWLRRENNKEKEKIRLQNEKENWPKKREKLIEKDLDYDSDKEKKYSEGLKGIGNKGYKLSTSFINKKKNEERLRLREKEREYDNALREKENQMLFKNIGHRGNLPGIEDLNSLLDKTTTKLLALEPEEKKPQTTFEIEDYNSNSNQKENNNNNNDYNEDKLNKNNKPKEEIKINNKPKEEKKEIKISDIKDFEEKKEDKEFKNKENEKEEKIQESYEINIEKMNLDQLLSGIPDIIFKDIQKNTKNIIPTKDEEIFKYNIDWDLINKYELKRKKIKKFIEKKLLDYFDEVDAFTKFILEKLGVLTPDELKEKLKYVLEENTDVSIFYY